MTENKEAAAATASEAVRNMYECYKEYETEGLVELKIEATDYYNAKGWSTVKLIQHELFPLN